MISSRHLLACFVTTVTLAIAGCPSGVDDREPDGAALYDKYCALCHGAGGEGYKADSAPQLANQELLTTATDGFLARAIAYGRSGTTMSAFGRARGGPLDDADVLAIVSYMRKWQTRPDVDVSNVKSSGDPRRAEPIYASKCAACHGATGVEGPLLHVTNPELIASARDGFLQHAIANGRPSTPMKAYKGELSAQEIDDLVVLLRAWAKPLPQGEVPYPGTVGPVVLNPAGPDPGFTVGQRYTPADVIKAALDRGSAMAFVDARAPSDYAASHVAGATNVPFYQVALYRDALPKDHWIVAYCGCPHAESGAVHDDLVSHGFTKVTILDEGFFVWRDRGYPVRSGASP